MVMGRIKMLTLLATALLFVANTVYAQLAEPVKWTFDAQKAANNEYHVILTAEVAQGWYLYSQYLPSDDGPVRTTIEFDQNPAIELRGKTEEEGIRKEGFDQMFGMNIIKFSGKVQFTQKIVVKATDLSTIQGKLQYMTCNGQLCLPPKDIPFKVTLR
jgi:hypothetical protein